MIDLPLALEQLTRDGRLQPGEDWGPSANTGSSYADFAAGWRGTSAVPTEQELADAWALVVVPTPEERQIDALQDILKALVRIVDRLARNESIPQTVRDKLHAARVRLES